jgi:hypothetical protein
MMEMSAGVHATKHNVLTQTVLIEMVTMQARV